MPTRDGLDHLERLLDGLAHRTDYPEFELIVVDNGSRDGTRRTSSRPGPRCPSSWRRSSTRSRRPTPVSNSQGGRARPPRPDPFPQQRHRALRARLAARAGRRPPRARESPGGGHPATTRGRVDDPSPRVTSPSNTGRSSPGSRKAGFAPTTPATAIFLFGPGFGLEDRRTAVTAACLLIEPLAARRVGGFGGGLPVRYRGRRPRPEAGRRRRTAGRQRPGDPLPPGVGDPGLRGPRLQAQQPAGQPAGVPRALGPAGAARLPPRPAAWRPLLDRRRRAARGDHRDQPRPGRRLGRLEPGDELGDSLGGDRLADLLCRAQGRPLV